MKAIRGSHRVFYHGGKTYVVECEGGEWPQFNSARVAIEHIEEIVGEAQATLDVLRKSGCFHEYQFVPMEDAKDFLKKTGLTCR